MESPSEPPVVQTEPEHDFAQLILVAESKGSHGYRGYCDAMASAVKPYVSDDVILAVSFFGSATAVKAVAAYLQTGASSHSIRLHPRDRYDDGDDMGDYSRYKRFCTHDSGYVIERRKSRMENYHLVAIAREPRLLIEMSEDCLYTALKSSTYTTPVVRSWMPWLLEQLQTRQMREYPYGSYLRKIHNYQTNAGLLTLQSDQLDELVSEGVRDGFLKMKG